jgi:hypothetical protein
MITRRQFILSAGSILGGLLVLQACSSSTSGMSYEEVAQRTWRHTKGSLGDSSSLLRELVRYATLAASSHNTQCWKFRVEARAISILPHLSRRGPAVDLDDHHLFVSLGCAAENLIQAALANALKGETRVDAAADGALRVALEPTKAVVSPLFEAIPKRQCTRAEFDGKPLSNEELRVLEQAGTGNGVRVLLLTERAAMEKVLEYVVQGNTAQMNDFAFVEELKTWIRFSYDEAVRTGDGLSLDRPAIHPFHGGWEASSPTCFSRRRARTTSMRGTSAVPPELRFSHRKQTTKPIGLKLDAATSVSPCRGPL